MHRLNDLKGLAQAIEERKPVVVGRKGHWRVDGGFWSAAKRLLNRSENVFVRLSRYLITELDSIESLPVRFVSSSEGAAKQIVDFQGYLEVAINLYAALDESVSDDQKALLYQLQDRTIALMYRLEGVNGGIDAQAWKLPLYEQLVARATEWKLQQTAFYGEDLDSYDVKRLEQAASYPAFVALLNQAEELRNQFFEWVIRDRVDVDVFVEYPALRERVAGSYLGSRIGRHGGDLLRIRREVVPNTGEESLFAKIVTLPFEGKEINILDPQRAVTFKGNHRLSIKQVFQVFAAKMEQVGDFEFLADGITNWNAHLLGWWDNDHKTYRQVDVDQAGWWKHLPMLERVSRREAQRRYGSQLKGETWALAANATRTTRTLDPDASHAFLEVVVPIGHDQYAVYAMGKFATTYAGSLFQSLQLFTATLHATVAYPDENIFYTHRERTRHSFIVTPAQGFEFMDSVKRDILASRAGSFTYQIESENCAKWIQDKMDAHFGEENVPDMFRLGILHTEPPGPTKKLFQMIQQLPEEWHDPIISAGHYLIGAWRGVWVEEDGEQVWRSVTNTKFWEDKVCYLPAMLHIQRTDGTLAVATVLVSLAAQGATVSGSLGLAFLGAYTAYQLASAYQQVRVGSAKIKESALAPDQRGRDLINEGKVTPLFTFESEPTAEYRLVA